MTIDDALMSLGLSSKGIYFTFELGSFALDSFCVVSFDSYIVLAFNKLAVANFVLILMKNVFFLTAVMAKRGEWHR